MRDRTHIIQTLLAKRGIDGARKEQPMIETTALNRQQVELLSTLVKAQQSVGPNYWEGFRGPTYGGIRQITLYHAGLPEDGIDVSGTDIYALREEGLVVVSRTPERTLMRIDLMPDAFRYIEELERSGGSNGRG
jgi:hypothetical protein